MHVGGFDGETSISKGDHPHLTYAESYFTINCISFIIFCVLNLPWGVHVRDSSPVEQMATAKGTQVRWISKKLHQPNHGLDQNSILWISNPSGFSNSIQCSFSSNLSPIYYLLCQCLYRRLRPIYIPHKKWEGISQGNSSQKKLKQQGFGHCSNKLEEG